MLPLRKPYGLPVQELGIHSVLTRTFTPDPKSEISINSFRHLQKYYLIRDVLTNEFKIHNHHPFRSFFQFGKRPNTSAFIHTYVCCRPQPRLNGWLAVWLMYRKNNTPMCMWICDIMCSVGIIIIFSWLNSTNIETVNYYDLCLVLYNMSILCIIFV